jgi:hypothetical protein
MIEPTLDDIGRRVVYIGAKYTGGRLDRGIITSFNEHLVFVRYGGKAGTTSAGTCRKDLEWADGTGNQSAKAGEAA